MTVEGIIQCLNSWLSQKEYVAKEFLPKLVWELPGYGITFF